MMLLVPQQPLAALGTVVAQPSSAARAWASSSHRRRRRHRPQVSKPQPQSHGQQLQLQQAFQGGLDHPMAPSQAMDL